MTLTPPAVGLRKTVGAVEDDHHQWRHGTHGALHPDGNPGQVLIGPGEAPLFLILLGSEGPDYPDAPQLFPQDKVDLVEFFLHDTGQRDGEPGNAHNDQNDQRHGCKDDHCQLGIAGKCRIRHRQWL